MVLSRRAWLEQTQSEVPTPSSTRSARARSARASLLDRELRRVRRPRRRRRPRARVRAVLEAHRPPGRGRRGRPGGHGRGPRRGHGPRARLAVAEVHQEDPWQQFARTHQIGQVVPAGSPSWCRSRVRPGREGIEGLVHIPELADRHVEIPEQVVQSGEEIFVKIIDIDLDPRRTPVAEAGQRGHGRRGGQRRVRPDAVRHAPTCDDQGNYLYPEGLTGDGDWLPGFEASVRSGSGSTPRPAPASRRTASRSRSPAPRRRRRRGPSRRVRSTASESAPRAPRGGRPPPSPARRPARWPRTRPWPHSARSSPVVRARNI